jgi:hypothetical protein
MLNAVVHHLRRNVIAYLALTIALLGLGGAAYAAIQLPNGSVGERQLKNKVIDPVKYDPTFTSGFVRRWATVNPNGTIASTSPNGTSISTGTGKAEVTWGDKFAAWCAPVVTVTGAAATPPAGTPSTTTPPTTSTPTTSTSATSSTTTSSTSTATPTPSPGAYAAATIVTRTNLSTLVSVATYNAQGLLAPEPFSLAVICGPGAGGAQTFPTNLP